MEVRVEPCDHHDHTYIWSDTTAKDTHTMQCKYFTTPFEPEQHTFVDKVCTVCGANETFGTGIQTMSDVRSQMSDAWYDMQGRKLQGKPTTKGVYINNGRSVVIK